METTKTEKKYAVKIPSYTKGYKLMGHLFQIYNITEMLRFSTGYLQSIKSDSYIDYENKGKEVLKSESFRCIITENPDVDDILIHPWTGASSVSVFDSLDKALVFKALINQKAKTRVFQELEELKKAVETQTKKIDIYNKDIIDKYPEYFL